VAGARWLKVGRSSASEPPLADYYVALALDRWFEPLCVPSPPDEAEDRLGKASFIDGMSSFE